MQQPKIINILDIGTSKITVVSGVYSDTEKTHILGVSSTPSAGFKRGLVVDLAAAGNTISKSIHACERMVGTKIQDIHLGITTPGVFSLKSEGTVAVTNPNSITTLDIQRATETAKAITVPANTQILHTIPNIFRIDNQETVADPLGMSGGKLQVEVLSIACPATNIRNIERAITNNGLKISSIHFSGLVGAANSLSSTEKELGAAYIDIGGSISNLCVYVEGYPVYAASIPMGGDHITNDLAIGLRLNIDEAEQLKYRLSKSQLEKDYSNESGTISLNADSPDSKKISTTTAINGIIRPRLEELFSYISEELTKSGYKSKIPSGIILTGGGSYSPLVKEICQKTLLLPCRIALPENIDGIIDDIRTAQYQTSIGLLEAIGKSFGTKKSNKLPPKIGSADTIVNRLKKLLEPFIP